MNFLWDEYGITATLVFGTSPHKCFVPIDDVLAIYSPELNAQFVMSPKPDKGPKAMPAAPETISATGKTGLRKSMKNVVKVDFTGKKRLKK
jgi:hypothetical protein